VGDPLGFTITNNSPGLLLIRMRSGHTIHLGVGETTGELPEPEISGNPRIEPLRERGLITVKTVASKAGPAAKERRPPAAADQGGAPR
jgi:hypothetical protein